MNGQNFLIEVDGTKAKRGFFEYHFCEARNPEEAEAIAVDKIRKNEELKAITLNSIEDPPLIEMTEIDEVDHYNESDETKSGVVWYQE